MSTLYRAAQSIDIATDGRNLDGLALRWNVPSKVTDNGTDFYSEAFSNRSAEKTLKERSAIPLPLGVWHPWQPGSPANESALLDEPVGYVRFRATNEGLAFNARLSRTDIGDEILGMVRAGELGDVSIGFVPHKSSEIDGVVVRHEIALYELSLAPTGHGQHQGAQVLAIRATTTDRASRIKWAKQRADFDLWIA